MKILTTTILFQLPDDFDGDDLNEALEEFIKYRKSKNAGSAKKSIADAKESKEFSNKMYDQFWGVVRDPKSKEKSVHASGVYKLSEDGKEWEDNE